MTESQNFLLTLVRMALWRKQEAMPDHKPDWKNVLVLAEKQTLLGLVAEAVPMLPEYLQPDPKSKMKLHTMAMRIIKSHSILNRKVADIKTRMDSNGIQTVLLKGQGVALNYPNPQSRQCGDIDIYVGENNFDQALRQLDPLSDEDYRYLKHFNITEDGVDIEVHRIAEILPGAKHDRLFQQWTNSCLEGNMLRQEEIGGVYINLPPVDFDAIYIMNHIWRHFMTGGIGLRQLCDWAMFLHRYHNDIDSNALSSNLNKFGLTRAWHILSALVVQHLGLPKEECPLYDGQYAKKTDKVLDIIWHDGNFGHYSSPSKKPDSANRYTAKFNTFKKITLRIIRIFSVSPIDVLYSWLYFSIRGIKKLSVILK